MAARMRLLYDLVISRDSPQFTARHCGGNFRVAIVQQERRELPERSQLVLADIVSFILGETVDKHRPPARAKQNNRSKAARLAASRTTDPLLDDAAAQIGVDKSTFGIDDRLAQGLVAEVRMAGEPDERLGLEYPH